MIGADALRTVLGSDLPDVDLSPQVAMDVLKNDRRRLIIQLVAEADEPITMKDAALAITRAEEECDPFECTAQERKRGYVGVTQTHAPKLEEHGALAIGDGDGVHAGLHATELTHDLNQWGRVLERHFTGDGTTPHQEHTDFEALREEVLSA